jgi:hypothetical protein
VNSDELLQHLRNKFPNESVHPNGNGGVSIQRADFHALLIEIDDDRYRVTPTSASTSVKEQSGRPIQFRTIDALVAHVAKFME